MIATRGGFDVSVGSLLGGEGAKPDTLYTYHATSIEWSDMGYAERDGCWVERGGDGRPVPRLKPFEEDSTAFWKQYAAGWLDRHPLGS